MRRGIRRLQSSPGHRAGCRLVVLMMLAVVGLATNPVASESAVVDPGLDIIMKMTPAGYQRAERDRLPEGPMSAATFNGIGATAVPVRADNAVVYGASYERADGAIIVFLGMSSSHRADGQAFADRVVEGTPIVGQAFDVGIDGVAGIQGESNRTPAASIAFARHGRGFAVMAFGDTARADCAAFATTIVGLAESTPGRSDASPATQLRPVAVAIAAAVAVALSGIVALWRPVQRRRRAPRRVEPVDTTETHEHPVPASPPRPSPRPSPR